MSEELNKKELDEVSGGVTFYYCYSFTWTCLADEIKNQREYEEGFTSYSLANVAKNSKKNAIQNAHPGKTVTFSNENIAQNGMVG